MQNTKIIGALFSMGLALAMPMRSMAAGHTLAVLEFDGGNDSAISSSDQQQLTQTVRGLARRNLPKENWTVLTRKDMDAKMPDASSCSDAACAIAAGKKLQADYVITGSAGTVGSYLQTSFSVYDVASGRLVGSEWPRGKTADDIIDSLKASPRLLFANLPQSNPGNAEVVNGNPNGNSKTVIVQTYPESRVVYYRRPVYVNPFAYVFIPLFFFVIFASAFAYHGR